MLDLFLYHIANQKELQNIYLHQRKEIKLRKNRIEKMRAREKKVFK